MVATEGAASSLTSANVAVAGEVAVPVTWTNVPEAVVTRVLSLVDSCAPPEQAVAYHATRMRALPILVPVGTSINPVQV